jgi:hypothetical protein
MSALRVLHDDVDRSTAKRAAAIFRARACVAIGPPVLHAELFAIIRAETSARRASAWQCAHAPGNVSPPQRNHRGELGRTTAALLQHEQMARLIRAVTGCKTVLSTEASCTTFYDAAGDFLGNHRDRPDACEVTALLYTVAESSPDDDAGLYLHANIPGIPHQPLFIRARENRMIILRGSAVTHGRPPISRGTRLQLVAACFSIDAN